MKPGHRSLTLPIVVLSLSAATLSCRMNLGGPESPASPPAASAAAATELARSWSSALAGAVDTGQLTVILTEEQLMSALASRLAGEQDPSLKSPRVYLRDGTIQVFGDAQEGMFEATVRLVIAPVLDEEGRLGFE
jgi:hypothetical protein